MKSNLKKRSKKFNHAPEKNLVLKQRAIYDIVLAVIVAIAVVAMFIFIIKGILTKDEEQDKITSKDYVAVLKDNKWGVIDSERRNCNRSSLWRNDYYTKQQK